MSFSADHHYLETPASVTSSSIKVDLPVLYADSDENISPGFIM